MILIFFIKISLNTVDLFLGNISMTFSLFISKTSWKKKISCSKVPFIDFIYSRFEKFRTFIKKFCQIYIFFKGIFITSCNFLLISHFIVFIALHMHVKRGLITDQDLLIAC